MAQRVFVGWSGPRSEAFAKALTQWLPKVLPVEGWMSARIEKGDRWFDQVGRQLSEHNIGLFCVTPENVDAGWMMFEAGALSKAAGYSRLCPVLLGLQPADLFGPLSEFQATVFDRADMLQLARSLNVLLRDGAIRDADLIARFDAAWDDLVRAVSSAASIRIPSETVDDVMRVLARNGLPTPVLGRDAFFSEGFETHALYSSAMTMARSRLYVFGRKNRKLFDKEHRAFFESLPDRVRAGFEFKVLFLNPKSPRDVLRAAHADPKFPMQLRASIEQAAERLMTSGLDPGAHMRFYDTHRSLAYLVVDEATAYAPLQFPHGSVEALTRCPFNLSGTGSALGAHLAQYFVEMWESSRVWPVD